MRDAETAPDETDLGQELFRVRNRTPINVGATLGVIAIAAGVIVLGEPTIGPRYVIGPIAITLGLILLAYGVLAERYHLIVCERGVYWRRGSLKGLREVPYEGFTRVVLPGTIPVYSGNVYLLSTFETGDGVRIPLNIFPTESGMRVLNALLPNVSTRLANEALERIKAGESVRVGKLELTLSGAALPKKRRVPWAEIGGTDMTPNRFRLFVKNRPSETMELPLNTPNLSVVNFLAGFMPDFLAANPDEARRAADRGDAVAAEDAPPVVVPGYADSDPDFGDLQCGRGNQGRWAGRTALAALPLIAGGIAAASAKVDPGIWIALVGVGGFLLLLALVFVANSGVAVYERGVVSGKTRVGFDEATGVAFGQTNMYHNGAYVGRQTTLSLRSPTGRVQLNGQSSTIEALSHEILARAVPILAKKAADRINDGGELAVGSLRFDAVGFRVGKKSLPLSRVSAINLNAGVLSIFGEGEKRPFATVSASAENFPVLSALLSALQEADERAGEARLDESASEEG